MANNGLTGIVRKFRAAPFSTVVYVDSDNKQIKFMSMVGRDKNSIALDVKAYRTKHFDEEFFERFTQCLREYGEANPSYSGKAAAVTVVLPDYLVATDTIKVPAIKKSEDMLSLVIESKYKNYKDLIINRVNLASNRQYTTAYLSVLRTKLMQSVYAACSVSNMYADKITFAGNALCNSLFSFNSKLKGASFLILDIKENKSRFAFVNKGMVTGAYNLPFGAELLRQEKIVAENMLFDHSAAELLVLNAKEKAKAKALTMMGGEISPEAAEEYSGEEEQSFSSEGLNGIQRQMQIKTLPKKTPRVLPKFMQRPAPETREELIYENFRYFIKWTLELIRANERLVSVSPFEKVLVNLPTEFGFLMEKANEEAKENKIVFVSAGLDKEKSVITENLELYGGFFVRNYNRINNF